LFVDIMSSAGTSAALSAGALLACFAFGCGPSPALPPATQAQVSSACPCDDDDADDEEDFAEAAALSKPTAYVRIDEWQPPPSVQELEARVMPRGDKPPTYVQLPRLTMHREITNTTIYRRGRYWH
jgi:hypothetical protein